MSKTTRALTVIAGTGTLYFQNYLYIGLSKRPKLDVFVNEPNQIEPQSSEPIRSSSSL